MRNVNGTLFRLECAVGDRPELDPALPPPDASPPEVKAGAASPARGTVLVIDDDETVLLVTARMIERWGMAVLSAANAESGLELFRANKGSIGAVLLDLTMPGMGGQQALTELRAEEPGVAVVFTSGYAERDVDMGPAGPAAFIQKPYATDELKGVLSRVMGID
jgi:two-component system, cell cycle sensor histidine kinase and response regulator CckA